jgi:hypothetical protein
MGGPLRDELYGEILRRRVFRGYRSLADADKLLGWGGKVDD